MYKQEIWSRVLIPIILSAIPFLTFQAQAKANNIHVADVIYSEGVSYCLTSKEKKDEIKIGDRLYLGDKINTGDNAVLIVKLKNGKTMRIKENNQFTLNNNYLAVDKKERIQTKNPLIQGLLLLTQITSNK